MSKIEDIDRALSEIDEEHKSALTGEQRETIRAVGSLLRETWLVLRGAAKMNRLDPDEHPADIARRLEGMIGRREASDDPSAAVSPSSEPSDVRKVFYGEACARGLGSTWAERFADLAVYLRLCGPDERRAPRPRNSPAPPSEEEIALVVRVSRERGDSPDQTIRAVVDLISPRASRSDDQPVADPAGRARLVARELRRRGLFVDVFGSATIAIHYPRMRGIMVGSREITVSADRYAIVGPRAIADEIQREEARRASEWAGDEESEG